MKHEIEKQIEFLMEIDKSKGILRMNWMLDQSRREDDAQHAWHACLTAMVLQKYAARPVDIGHVIQMLLVHDIVEIDAGDTYAYDEKGYESKPQREQAAAEALEYEKAKKELKKQDAEIDRKGKIAALFCKAYEKAVLLTPSEENIRCWTDGTRMTPEEMRDTVKESRELAEVFRTIADIIEQKILPADWRCADAESEENDAQSDGNPA